LRWRATTPRRSSSRSSPAAILRFTRLQDVELLERLKDICTKEGVKFTMDGLEALIFTADGDLRQAINALQSTAAGFDLVDQTSVFKVPSAPTASTT